MDIWWRNSVGNGHFEDREDDGHLLGELCGKWPLWRPRRWWKEHIKPEGSECRVGGGCNLFTIVSIAAHWNYLWVLLLGPIGTVCLAVLRWLVAGFSRGDTGSVPWQSVWGLWWVKWPRSRFFSEYFGFTTPVIIPPMLHTPSSGSGVDALTNAVRRESTIPFFSSPQGITLTELAKYAEELYLITLHPRTSRTIPSIK